MDGTDVTTIDLASVFKDMILNTPNIKYIDDSYRDIIMKSDDDILLRVKKGIGSLTIKSVDIVTDDMIRKEILGK